MTDFLRTPDKNFCDLEDFHYKPNYHEWKDMRMHFIDEGPKDAPVMLLLHGMPTWAYLYRDVIPTLLESGYRCIAPDYLGFCLLYTSPSPRDGLLSRMPSSA